MNWKVNIKIQKKNNKIKIYNYFGLFEYKCVAS